MSSLNQIQLIGHLGKAPELRALPDGTAVCALSLATNEKHKGRDGQAVEHTEWHRVVLFGRQAEIAAEYTGKGGKVFVQGRLRTRDYTDREGQVRRIVEVVADKLVLLDPPPRVGGDSGRLDQYRQPPAPASAGPFADMADAPAGGTPTGAPPLRGDPFADIPF